LVTVAAHVRHVHRAPLPGGPEHVGEQALHEAGRHVDQEALDLAEGHRFEMEADRFERPAIDQLAALRLEGVPEVADELDEATAPGPLPAQLVEVLTGR
jgi:hypothetical protein